MAFQKQETTLYLKAQSAKGSAVTIAAEDAIQITADTTLVKPEGNQVERTVLRPGARLGAKKLVIGRWGVGDIGTELHAGTAKGVAPEFGPLLKSLLGQEDIVADTSVTYSINTTGDITWLTVEQYEDGAKYLATNARCRAMSLTVTNREISALMFSLKSLACQESDAYDSLTPVWDDMLPLVGVDCTFTVGGVSTNIKSLELSIENAKEDSYVNDGGLGNLPEDSTLAATGTITPEMTNTAPLTAFFNGTLAELVLISSRGAGKTCTITISGVQYDKPEANEEDGDLQWSIPYTVTGGLTIAFT